MHIDILSLFPDYFVGPFDESIIKQARKKGLVEIQLVNIRDFSDKRYHQVDDRPYGGGPGMVLMAEPTVKAIRSVKKAHSHVVYLSPQGTPLSAKKCRELASYEHLVLLCGHYEGVDERVLELEVDEEISIGDYVLTNGCLSAIVLVDALVRFVPNVLGHECAANSDSFEKHLLDCPHFTRPEIFEGMHVPEVLLSGDHKKIDSWRFSEAMAKTKQVRPDLFVKYWLDVAEGSEESSNKKTLLLEKKCRAKLTNPRLSQIKLFVKNLKKSVKFYRDVVGFFLIQQAENNATFSFVNSSLQLIEGKTSRDNDNGAVLNIIIEEEHAIQSLAKRISQEASGTYLLKECSDILQAFEFCDPDNYLWCVHHA